MNILDKIIERKKEEVAELKAKYSIADLEALPYFGREVLSFRDSLLNPNKSGIISEFKRKSPSKGIINDVADVVQTTKAYTEAGVSAISVLTDVDFFKGENENLIKARVNDIPLLRKDFIIDEYQILEAKGIGADIILLIASNLSVVQCKTLAAFCKSLGLNVLLEIHDETELKYIGENIDAVGVNNRNLKTFEVSVETSKHLSTLIPDQFLKISESGLSDPNTIKDLKDYGYQGFLIGENFMKTDNPGLACKQFIDQLK